MGGTEIGVMVGSGVDIGTEGIDVGVRVVSIDTESDPTVSETSEAFEDTLAFLG